MSARSAAIGSSKPGQLRGVVLPVAVDLDRDLEAVVSRVLVAGLDRAADADVVGQTRDERPRPLGLGLGAVGRPVVDDEDLEARVHGADLFDHTRDRRRLVQGGHNGDPTHGHSPVVMGCRLGLGDGPHKIRILRGSELDLLSGL